MGSPYFEPNCYVTSIIRVQIKVSRKVLLDPSAMDSLHPSPQDSTLTGLPNFPVTPPRLWDSNFFKTRVAADAKESRVSKRELKQKNLNNSSSKRFGDSTRQGWRKAKAGVPTHLMNTHNNGNENKGKSRRVLKESLGSQTSSNYNDLQNADVGGVQSSDFIENKNTETSTPSKHKKRGVRRRKKRSEASEHL